MLDKSISELIDLLRRKPDQALAQQILGYLRQFPQIVLSMPLQDLALLHRFEGPVKFSADEQKNDTENLESNPPDTALADFYADLWNDYRKDGLWPDMEEIEQVASELEDAGLVIEFIEEDGVWISRKAVGDEEPVKYEVNRAPKGGVSINGKQYRGGQFIPDKDFQSADPKTKEKIEQANEVHKKTKERRIEARKARTVDIHGFKGRLFEKVANVELNQNEITSAKKSLAGLARHHGKLVYHRLEELASKIEEAYEKSNHSEVYLKKLKQIHDMIGFAQKPKSKYVSLFSVVRRLGGISVANLKKDYNISEDFIQAGLLGLIRKNGGLGLDDIAKTLHAEGHTNSDDQDYLLNLLKQKAISRHSEIDGEIETEEEKYYREKENAIKEGISRETIERIRNEARKTAEGKGDSWEGDQELADEEISFDPGDFDESVKKKAG